jgi:hypothetical protein
MPQHFSSGGRKHPASRLALTSCLLKTSGRSARIMSFSPDGKWASDAFLPSGEKIGHDRPTLPEVKAGTHRTIDAC